MSVSTATIAAPTTLTDALFPRRTDAILRDALLVVGASLLVAACAQIAIPLPGNPVPITGQTFGVLLTGIVLGRQRGLAALLLYLAEGAMGLPVFAHGPYGLVSFYGPTAGYLFAFPIAAFVVGWLAERGWDRKPITAAASMLIGALLILTMGSLALTHFVGSVSVAFEKGFIPFVVGELIKVAAAAGLLPTAWHLIDSRRSQQR